MNRTLFDRDIAILDKQTSMYSVQYPTASLHRFIATFSDTLPRGDIATEPNDARNPPFPCGSKTQLATAFAGRHGFASMVLFLLCSRVLAMFRLLV